MPDLPIIIGGIVKNSDGDTLENVFITFSITNAEKLVLSESDGAYIIDLANMGASYGETVNISEKDKFGNEVYTGTTTAVNQTLNISLSVREDYEDLPNNRGTIINKKSTIIQGRLVMGWARSINNICSEPAPETPSYSRRWQKEWLRKWTTLISKL